MDKNRVIIFKNNSLSPVILTNPPELDMYYTQKNAYVNPNMKAVKGLPPHMWEGSQFNNSIVPKEGAKRMEAISAGNKVIKKPLTGLGKQTSKWVKSTLILTIINSLGIMYCVYAILSTKGII